jgi:hypothetical protein
MNEAIEGNESPAVHHNGTFPVYLGNRGTLHEYASEHRAFYNNKPNPFEDEFAKFLM